jgi:hypothetical protein
VDAIKEQVKGCKSARQKAAPPPVIVLYINGIDISKTPNLKSIFIPTSAHK